MEEKKKKTSALPHFHKQAILWSHEPWIHLGKSTLGKKPVTFWRIEPFVVSVLWQQRFPQKKKKKPPAAGRRRFTVTNTRGNKTPLFESEPRKQEEPTERASAGFIPFWTSPASQGHIIHLIETQSQVKWSLTKLLLPRWWCRLKSISTLINRQPLVNKCVEPSGVSTEEISLPPSLSGCFNADAFLQDKLDSSGSQTRSVQTLQLDFAKREN